MSALAANLSAFADWIAMPLRVKRFSACPTPTDTVYNKTMTREDAVRNRGSKANRSHRTPMNFFEWSSSSSASDESPSRSSRSVTIPRRSTAQKKALSINSRSESRGRKPDQEIEERSSVASPAGGCLVRSRGSQGRRGGPARLVRRQPQNTTTRKH